MCTENLAPIKIFLSYFDENSLKIANELAHIYKVRVVDSDTFLSSLLDSKGYEALAKISTPKFQKKLDALLTAKLNVLFQSP